MSIDPRTPCVIGAAQRTWHLGGTEEAPEPVDGWAEVARAAAADAGASGGIDAVLGRLDALRLVYCQSWPYDDPPARLAERLGIDRPGLAEYAGIGGTKPQELIADTARRMLAGELDLAFVCGGEALDTKRRLRKADLRPAWSFRDPERKPFPLEAPFLDTEIAHEVFQAWLTFALFDIGRRADRGRSPDEHRRSLGELFAPLTEVAAANPQAWYPVARSAEELITPSAENRMVGYPYTKYLVSVMDVDMAAGLLMATHAQADALGVPADRRVYLRGWCYLTDATYVAEHDTFAASPAMPVAASEALRCAGVGIDDVAHLDLYSCFASSLAYACDALGVAPTDDRGLTVTGGLPYFGGPGSNYLSHSIATMVDVLRADAGSVGMVSGVGMHMTKHVFGLYSTTPPEDGLSLPDESTLQARLDADHPRRSITPSATGSASVATYSVVHGRDGQPAWALLVCDLPDGTRCHAKVLNPALLGSLEAEEWVGRSVSLSDGGGGVNVAVA